jgi:pyruvate/2-oxoglutarate dehydrogenase complex dihydrolipoamide dehydrogenase (E3) component
MIWPVKRWQIMVDVIEVLPKDEYNATLVANVRPKEWKNPEPAKKYSLVVIGAGMAGQVAAIEAASLGAKVALVERRLLGGEYLNFGCIPSKSLVRSSRAVADVRRAPQFGIRIMDGAEIDFPAVMERMRQVRTRISYSNSVRRFHDLGVDVFIGEGKFAGPDSVAVDGKILRFKKALIATGSRPVKPQIEGLEEAGYLTNETLFSLTDLPRRMAILGAGSRGCELAQALQRLGCTVTLIDSEPQILINEDPEAAAVVARAMASDGVVIRTSTTVRKVTVRSGKKVLQAEIAGNNEEISVDEIMLGEGRMPNVEGLKLEDANVDYDLKWGIKVGDGLRTTNKKIYAAGDVCLSHKLANTAAASARIALHNALFRGRKRGSSFTLSWCTYTDPEIAHVGLSETDAERKKLKIVTHTRLFSEVDRGIIDGEEDGFIRIYAKKRSDKIVGATVVARHAGEMVNELTMAMVGKVGLKKMSDVVRPYPTQADAVRQIADIYNLERFRRKFLPLFMKR